MKPITFFEEHPGFRLRDKNRHRTWLTTAAVSEKKNIESLSIIFCSDAFLKTINKKFLNHDYFTDVITFPFSEAGSKNIGGEIYISIDRVRENAKQYAFPFGDELRRIMVHGLLHLCGDDDSTIVLKERMRKKEDRYLLRYQ